MRQKNAHIFNRADNEWYSEPPSCTAALLVSEKFEGRIHDPCAGMGNIVRTAALFGYEVSCSDLVPRLQYFPLKRFNYDRRPTDFLDAEAKPWKFDNIIMNPPYGRMSNGDRLEERFIDRALWQSRRKLAVFMRFNWYVARRSFLLCKPLALVMPLTPRPSVLPGNKVASGEKPEGGAIEYCWFVFDKEHRGDPIIRHCQRDKTFDDDANWHWRLS